MLLILTDVDGVPLEWEPYPKWMNSKGYEVQTEGVQTIQQDLELIQELSDPTYK